MRVSTYLMKWWLLFVVSLALAGCGDLPDSSEVQDQQLQRSFYGTGNPAANNPPPYNAPPSDPVPGEVVPDR